MDAGYGQVTGGVELATAIGALLPGTVLISMIVALVRVWCRRSRRGSQGDVHAAKRDGPGSAVAPAGEAAVASPRPGLSSRRLAEHDRSALLIAEALVVRELLAGQIDAPLYRARMHELAAGGRNGTQSNRSLGGRS